MCILCAGARLSRRVVAMLPWLIIPFIFAWAFSQFLSPVYRLEITSPRLACVGVLLCSLFWYELIVPRLSEWRDKRAILLRERQRIEAQKAARWRKEAVKHCRNCHSAYRDQNAPAIGKYMCSNCGHASKKPELHVPGEPRPVKGCGVAENRCWSTSAAWEELEKQAFFQFVVKCVSGLVGLAVWLWKKVGKHERVADGCSGRKMSGREVEDVEERRMKARRKAEERRVARLEREKKEEEERRDREEIKRLVDERSRLRAEEIEREAALEREMREMREREAERKKQEEKREKEQKEMELRRTKAEAVERETPKSPEPARRKDRSFYKNFRTRSYGVTGSVRSMASRIRTSLPSRGTVDVKSTAAAVSPPVKEVTAPSRMSWSSVLSGSKTPTTTTTPTSATSPKQESSPKSSPTPKTCRTPKPYSPPMFITDPKSPRSVSAPVPADPIYLPGTAPALPPISAPHNVVNSEPTSPSIFTPFFPPTGFAAVSCEDSFPVPLTSTPLSADAPPFSSSCYPASSKFTCNKKNTVELPEDLCLSSAAAMEPPVAFRDFFTGGVMSDPVTTADGYSYDRPVIEAWLATHNSSPITGMQLPSAPPADSVDRRLFPNLSLRSQISDYHERKARERAAAISWPAAAIVQPHQHHHIGGLYVDPLWSFERGECLDKFRTCDF